MNNQESISLVLLTVHNFHQSEVKTLVDPKPKSWEPK